MPERLRFSAPCEDPVSLADTAAAEALLAALSQVTDQSDGTPLRAGPPEAGTALAALRADLDRRAVLADPLAETLQRTARTLDNLAAGISTSDPAADALLCLRRSLDGDIAARSRPAVAARRRMPHRALRTAGVAAIAVVMATGSVTAAAAAAHPGADLYGLRVALLGRTPDDPVLNDALLTRASAELERAKTGVDPTGAHTARGETLLAEAARNIPTVADVTERRRLSARLASLTSILRRKTATAKKPHPDPKLKATTPPSAAHRQHPRGSNSRAHQHHPTPTPTPTRSRTGPPARQRVSPKAHTSSATPADSGRRDHAA